MLCRGDIAARPNVLKDHALGPASATNVDTSREDKAKGC
jgi:hypothetical protein